VTIGLVACGSSSSGDATSKAPDYKRALAGAPMPLADLYAHAGELLSGGTASFEHRLGALRGYPIVVNKWASWCGPCHVEFPWFQDLSAKLGKRIAFLGVDSNDSDAAAKTFLGELPVPYPSYSDPSSEIAKVIKATVGFPGTAFYDRQGNLAYVKQGQYPNEAALAADINRYAE
jgi:thiol-disulfide isomerase/thioredoxin